MIYRVLKVLLLVQIVVVLIAAPGCTMSDPQLKRYIVEAKPAIREAGASGGQAFAEAFSERIGPSLERLDDKLANRTGQIIEDIKPALTDAGQSMGESFGKSFSETLGAQIAGRADEIAGTFAKSIGEELTTRVSTASIEIGDIVGKELGDFGDSADAKFDEWLQEFFKRYDTSREREREEMLEENIQASLNRLNERVDSLTGQPERMQSQLSTIITAVIATATLIGVPVALLAALMVARQSRGEKNTPIDDHLRAFREYQESQHQRHQALMDAINALVAGHRGGQGAIQGAAVPATPRGDTVAVSEIQPKPDAKADAGA